MKNLETPGKTGRVGRYAQNPPKFSQFTPNSPPKSEHMEGLVTLAFFPSISACYKGLISYKKYFGEFQLSIMKKNCVMKWSWY